MTHNYPEYRVHLSKLTSDLKLRLPGVLEGFGELHEAGMKAGALDAKTKELIALGIAISARCDGCIAYHVKGVLDAGASEQEILECIGVAIVMGGGPSVVYGTQAFEALQQYIASGQKPES